MTYEEICEMVLEMGLPFAYHHFAEGESPKPPFVLFLSPREHTFGADDLMYISFKRLDIELYTDEKSPDAEQRVEEILTQYGDLCLIWFDVPSTISREQCLELQSMVRAYQPGCLINGRLGYGIGDYSTPGDNMIADGNDGLCETVGTMNDSWGYRPTDVNYKTVEEIKAIKSRCAAIGSNYMLNIGPDPLGRIPAAAISILDGLKV